MIGLALQTRVFSTEGPTILTVDVEDEDVRFASFTDAFGDFAGDAVHEATHRALATRIENGGARWTGPIAARYKLTRGRIELIRP